MLLALYINNKAGGLIYHRVRNLGSRTAENPNESRIPVFGFRNLGLASVFLLLATALAWSQWVRCS